MIRGDAPTITKWLRTIARFMVAFYFVGMFVLLATNDLDSIISDDFDDAFISLDNDQDKGHSFDPFSLPRDPNTKIVLRTTKERLEAKKQSKETQSHNHNGREH